MVIFILPLLTSGKKPRQQVLWKQGSGDYRNYRIPSILCTPKGTLLAFCEGRVAGDTGDIDLLLRRSEDNGKTWNKEMIVWDDGGNSCGNPCPVADTETGRIWLFLTHNAGRDHENQIIRKNAEGPRDPYLCYSDDDGLTWSEPENMGGTIKDPSWGWYATGPGIGIQLRNGNHKGRLVIPANHSYDDPEGHLAGGPFSFGAHVLLSDDHGKSWKTGQQIKPGCNESQVTELNDGTLLMNMRSYNNKNCRAVSFSKDGGETWSDICHEPQLTEPVCQASILAFGYYRGKTCHLFSNPAVPSGRTHMTIKTSFDGCKNWSNGKLVYPGPSAYSCLTRLKNGHAGLLFECGADNPYETIRFISFRMDALFRPGMLTQDE